MKDKTECHSCSCNEMQLQCKDVCKYHGICWMRRAAEVIAVAVIGVCAVRETDDTMRDR